MIKNLAGAAAGAFFGVLVVVFWASTFPVLHAEHLNISQSDLAELISAQPVTPGGTYTSKPFKALGRTNTQSFRVRGVGTSPNYKVEILVSLDYDPPGGVAGTFTKPEVGGDLGTFTDQNYHVVPAYTPLCVAQQLKITELGGANSVVISALGLGQ